MLVCIYAVLRRGMGAWYFQQKSPQAIQKAIRWDPCNAEYYDALATLRHLYADNENPGEQVQLYLHATSFSPQNAHFWTDLGMAYDWAGNRNEAMRAFAQSSAEIREINAVARIDSHASRPGSFRKRVFRDLHCRWIDFSHFIGRKLAEDGDALAINGDPIGMRIRRGDMFQFDFSCAGIKPSHHIGGLQREPQQAMAIKDGCVGILALGIGNLVFRHGAGLGVEFA